MRTSAYLDYVERMREVIVLLRIGLAAQDPAVGGATAKAATVLAAAALERFLSDAILQSCERIGASKWEDLSQGQVRYFYRQMARRLLSVTEAVVSAESGPNESKQKKIRDAIEDCQRAFDNPSTWPHHREFGLFSDGPAEPGRLSAILRDFEPAGLEIYAQLDAKGRDRAQFLAALTQLIDARHAAAHALPGHTPPGPKDAQAWIVLSFWLTREIEKYLLTAVPP